MKKTTRMSLFIIIVAIALLFASNVYCFASAVAETQPSEVKAKLNISQNGDDITVYGEITENPGVKAISLQVLYDKKELTLNSASYGSALSSMNRTDNAATASEYYRIICDGLSADSTTGTLFVLHFKVNEKAINGNYNMPLYLMEYWKDMVDGQKYYSDSNSVGYLLSSCTYSITGHIAPASSKNLALIIGISCGAVVVVVIVLLGVFKFRKKATK